MLEASLRRVLLVRACEEADPGGRILPLRARVMHTNVPGNLQRVSVPLGMGVRFEDPGSHDVARLDRLIQQRHRTLLV